MNPLVPELVLLAPGLGRCLLVVPPQLLGPALQLVAPPLLVLLLVGEDLATRPLRQEPPCHLLGLTPLAVVELLLQQEPPPLLVLPHPQREPALEPPLLLVSQMEPLLPTVLLPLQEEDFYGVYHVHVLPGYPQWRRPASSRWRLPQRDTSEVSLDLSWLGGERYPLQLLAPPPQ